MSTQSLWYKSFKNFEHEHSFVPLKGTGTIPKELSGTYYRNGVGEFSAFGGRLPHWFDGTGLVCAIKLHQGKSFGAARLVRSARANLEHKAGKHLFGSYGFAPKGIFRSLFQRYRNAANTSLMYWNNQLYTLWEGGLPIELSDDLHVVGHSNFGGVIKRSFSAHPHFVPKRQAYYNFGIRMFPIPCIDLYRMELDGSAHHFASIPFRGCPLLHDFIATENHLIFIIPPVGIHGFSVLFGRASIADAMYWNDSLRTQILVIPIDNVKKRFTLDADPMICIHSINGFEIDGRLHLDVIRAKDFSGVQRVDQMASGTLRNISPSQPYRLVVNTNARDLSMEQLRNIHLEFPHINHAQLTKKARFMYGCTFHPPQTESKDWYNAIAKIDLDSRNEDQVLSFGPGTYPSEPMFVSRQDSTQEDDGFLLSIVYDAIADKSYLAILDAQDLSLPPLATIEFPNPLPLQFHGIWVPKKS